MTRVNADNPHVLVAQHAGACYGVQRALSMVEEQLDHIDNVYTLGPLIHNPVVVDELDHKGAHVIENPSDVPKGSVLIIRSHGTTLELIDAAIHSELQVVDATCPHVKKAHEAAASLVLDGYQVIVVGEAGHPEVEGILSRAGKSAVVAQSAEELSEVTLSQRVGVVVQTTQSQTALDDVVLYLLNHAREVKVFNTICSATTRRQQSALQLAELVDVMLVIGGKNSGNTRRLVDVCKRTCSHTYHIERPDEIQPSWFSNCSRIGITAGASTPKRHIDECVEYLQSFCTE